MEAEGRSFCGKESVKRRRRDRHEVHDESEIRLHIESKKRGTNHPDSPLQAAAVALTVTWMARSPFALVTTGPKSVREGFVKFEPLSLKLPRSLSKDKT